MASANLVAGEGSTRSLLVNSTERIMLEDGYAAVTYRNVAAKAGVSLGAVQYHFPSLDDLFLAVVRQYTERTLETMMSALRDDPDDVLSVLWKCSGDEVSSALLMEFLALVNHRKSIYTEIAVFGEQYRKVQVDALTENWEKLNLPEYLTPNDVAFLLTCLPRWLRLEASFGLTDSDAEIWRPVQRLLERAQPDRSSPSRRKSTLGGSDPGEFPTAGAALRLLGKRAALSARTLVHYARMARTAWASRDGQETTDGQ